jgi:hypothetical protein
MGSDGIPLHGTPARYQYGCRCGFCVRAWACAFGAPDEVAVYCREWDCERPALANGYCRAHGGGRA